MSGKPVNPHLDHLRDSGAVAEIQRAQRESRTPSGAWICCRARGALRLLLSLRLGTDRPATARVANAWS